MANKQDLVNVNVTLGASGSDNEKLLGKEFPCPVCGAAMLVRLTFLRDHPKPANEGHLKTGQR